MTTIVKLELADKDNSTDVVDLITLSTGQVIKAWAGKPCYTAFDKAVGSVEVGAKLVSVEDAESYKGETYKVYTFA